MTRAARAARPLLAVMLAAGIPSVARAASVDWESGFSAATGRYVFDQSTTTLWWSNGVTVLAGPGEFRCSWPVVAGDTPLVSLGSAGPLPSGGPLGPALGDTLRRRGSRARSDFTTEGLVAREWRVSLGDPIAGAALVLGRGEWTTRIGIAVKAPLAADEYSTGEWDFAGSAGIAWLGRSSLGFDLSGSRWWWGDPPGLDLRDAWSGMARITRVDGRGGSLSAHVEAATSALEGYAAPASVGIGSSHPVGSRAHLRLGVRLGITETASRVAGTLATTVRLGGS